MSRMVTASSGTGDDDRVVFAGHHVNAWAQIGFIFMNIDVLFSSDFTRACRRVSPRDNFS